MYTPNTPPMETAERLMRNLTVIFGSQAQRIFDECNGQATTVIDRLRHASGPRWEILRAARAIHEEALLEVAANKPAFTDPRATQEFLKHYMSSRPYESFVLVLLSNRHRLIAVKDLFRGTIDGASVHPREVVREVLEHNAAAVIFAHNHPSGVAEPSLADELITRRLRDALALVDVRVLDHLIVSGSSCCSFASRGVL